MLIDAGVTHVGAYYCPSDGYFILYYYFSWSHFFCHLRVQALLSIFLGVVFSRVVDHLDFDPFLLLLLLLILNVFLLLLLLLLLSQVRHPDAHFTSTLNLMMIVIVTKYFVTLNTLHSSVINSASRLRSTDDQMQTYMQNVNHTFVSQCSLRSFTASI